MWGLFLMSIELRLAKGCFLYEIGLRVAPTESGGRYVTGAAWQEEANGLVRFED